jgi:hypothetical protein
MCGGLRQPVRTKGETIASSGQAVPTDSTAAPVDPDPLAHRRHLGRSVYTVLAMSAVLYFAARYLGGAAREWTVIATIARARAVTAKGIGSSVTHLSEAAERPIHRQEEVDAMARAITTLPSVQVTNGGVRLPSPERCSKDRRRSVPSHALRFSREAV